MRDSGEVGRDGRGLWVGRDTAEIMGAARADRADLAADLMAERIAAAARAAVDRINGRA